jgi:hypothetical protein
MTDQSAPVVPAGMRNRYEAVKHDVPTNRNTAGSANRPPVSRGAQRSATRPPTSTPGTPAAIASRPNAASPAPPSRFR